MTYVIVDVGCTADAPSNCKESRGGLFDKATSLTWVPNSIFQLGLSENLGVNIFGDFGFDTVTLGWQGSGGPTVEHSIVAGVGDTHFTWLGGLGLNPRPTNFSTFPNSPQVSLIQSLKNERMIPSVSWAYTAGAPYRLDKVFGSLVLGGYDMARFEIPKGTSPALTFPFYADIARDLQVGISSIKASSSVSSSSSTTLLSDGIFAFIDSTVPYLYLPEEVCTAFENAFGITWNSTSELYLLNSTHHEVLMELDPSITITLTPSLADSSPESQVEITFPYSAFDLQIAWPHAGDATRYFPLKRATNDTQYTLGRAFLQEAYLIADYERGNFSVWPCKWDASTNSARVVAIRSTNDTTSSDNESGVERKSDGAQSLNSGAIAGIVIGGVVLLIAVPTVIFYCLRRRKRRSQVSSELSGDNLPLSNVEAAPAYYPQKQNSGEELDSTARHELQGHNSYGVTEKTTAAETTQAVEIEAKQAATELPGQEQIFEMDAGHDIVKTGPEIYLEPATAVSPHEGSFVPDPLENLQDLQQEVEATGTSEQSEVSGKLRVKKNG